MRAIEEGKFTLQEYQALSTSLPNTPNQALVDQYGFIPQKTLSYNQLILGNYLFNYAMRTCEKDSDEQTLYLHISASQYHCYHSIKHCIAILIERLEKNDLVDYLMKNIPILGDPNKEAISNDVEPSPFNLTIAYIWLLARKAMRLGTPGFSLMAGAFSILVMHLNLFQLPEPKSISISEMLYEYIISCLIAAKLTLSASQESIRNSDFANASSKEVEQELNEKIALLALNLRSRGCHGDVRPISLESENRKANEWVNTFFQPYSNIDNLLPTNPATNQIRESKHSNSCK